MISKIKSVVVLGSTGSVGVNTLDIINKHLDKYKIFALSANSNVDKLFEQCISFKPSYAIMIDLVAATQLQDKLNHVKSKTQVLAGVEDLCSVIADSHVDIVMSAIVGSAGLLPTYTAVSSGKKVLLANKESMVVAGEIINQALSNNSNASIIPVDSEHSAIFQCLPHTDKHSHQQNGVRKVILTASGGPFRAFTAEQMLGIKVAQALKHPNWEMGQKITIDSSTLMNKGLELIEAKWLFNLSPSQLEVVVHPQSIIHSMVEYVDGSIIAQMGTPDMRTPIAYALAYPQRIDTHLPRLDFTTIANLTFEQPDLNKFPCLKLAFDVLDAGGIMPTILNASNEIVVNAFLKDQIGFYDINELVEKSLNHFSNFIPSSVDDILDFDIKARKYTQQILAKSQ